MLSTDVSTSNVAFEPNLKTNPRLMYRKFRARLIFELSNSCNDITENRGLIFFLFSPTQWYALPGNTYPDANGDDVQVEGYDLDTALTVPAANAAAIAVKMFEFQRTDRKEVRRCIAEFTRKFNNSLPQDDISELSHELYGTMNVTLRQFFAHTERKYGILNQADFDHIFDTLQTPKLPTQDYAVLADIHREMHALLAGADQVSTEYQKTQYFMQALKDDPAGKHATKIFLREYPSIPDRRFTDLVEIVILHAPTYIATNSTLGYSNAMSVASVSAAFAAPTDELGLAQFIAKHQKDLAAIKKKNGTTAIKNALPPRNAGSTGPLKYCYKHGYQRSHAGAACLFLNGNPQLYNAQHLAATDHLTPAGGNPTSRG